MIRLLILWASSENKFFNSKKLIKDNALSDRETILHLKNNPRTGIIRFGNSELGLIVGNSAKTQEYNHKLKNILVDICFNYNSINNKKYLITLPLDTSKRKGVPSWYPGRAAKWAMKFLVKKNQKYGTHCFRITEVIDDDMDSYIGLIKNLFLNRDIVYVGPLDGKNPDIPKFITPKEVLKIPEKNAFEQTENIITQIKNICKNYKDPLVGVVGGITACAISYELNMSNITCYDFGQYERLYKKYINSNRYI